MAVWRIRTEVRDRPGELAAVARALAERDGNILGMSVQIGARGVLDEFLVEAPGPIAPLVEDVGRAGGRRCEAIPSRPGELIDETTRALLLAARVRSDPAELPAALCELLRADDATWTRPSEDGLFAEAGPAREADASTPAGRAGPVATGPGTGVAGGGAGMTGAGTMIVAVGPLRSVRIRRPGWPFTLTEAARADALARSALPLPGPRPALREVPLSNGATVRLRPIGPGDVPALHALHGRCSPDTRRMRYFSAMPRLAPRVVEVLCDADRGLTLVAEVGGRLVGMANLMYAPEPGVGEMAFLIEDSWQNRGLGTATACRLMEIARDWGMAEVRASTLLGNRRMARILTGLGATLTRGDDHVVEARLPVTATCPT